LNLPLSQGPESGRLAGSNESNDGDDREHHHATSAPLQNVASALHVLVVDDSVSNRKLLMRMLKNRGHTCEEACDGQEAVLLVKEASTPFDSILLDYEMPVMDGPTACKQMRQMGCSCFVVGVTGNLMPEDIAYFK
jgi:CheY-like chemotaxis protein